MDVIKDLMKDEGHALEHHAYHMMRPDLRIVELHLGPMQEVPWHYHNYVQDTFYMIRGEIRVQVRDPGEDVRLMPGETYRVSYKRPHRVTNVGGVTAAFLVIQGIGEYDFAH